MQILKLLRRGSVRFVKRARALSQAAAIAVKQWRRQPVLDALEAERLDRIRNPSKYLGKS
jgi:hypothetical protein